MELCWHGLLRRKAQVLFVDVQLDPVHEIDHWSVEGGLASANAGAPEHEAEDAHQDGHFSVAILEDGAKCTRGEYWGKG